MRVTQRLRLAAWRRRRAPTFATWGLTILAAMPASAADCVSGHGLVETVRPCPAGDATSTMVAVAELPHSVSVVMPAARAAAAKAMPVAAKAAAHPLPHAAIVADVASRYRIDPGLLTAMIRAESGGDAGAISPKGALGLMQVMPATARGMGIADPAAMLADPALAIEAGAAYLKTLQSQLGNDVTLVVAAYNAGPGAVLRAGRRVPAFRETQAYVGKVMAGYTAARAGALR